MHPFYGPSRRLVGWRERDAAGVLSMAAHLGFWAVALALAIGILGERYAQGDFDEATFRHMRAVLAEDVGRGSAG